MNTRKNRFQTKFLRKGAEKKGAFCENRVLLVLNKSLKRISDPIKYLRKITVFQL